MATEEYKKNLEIAKMLSDDYKKREKVIQALYDKFDKEYLSQDEGISHSLKYGYENEEVNRVYNEIIKKRNNNEPYEEDVFDKLFDREYQVHWDNRSKAIKSFLKRNYDEEGIKEVARYFIGLVEVMTKEGKKDKSQINNHIMKLRENSKQIGTNRLSSILYYLDTEDKYYVINTKTVDTVKLLSKMFKLDIKLKTGIENYSESNNELHMFLNTLSYDVKELGDFQTFDTFCHWMCDSNLGSYARYDAKNVLPSIDDL